MYTLYRSPATFYECLITVVITLPGPTTAQTNFLHYPLAVLEDIFEEFENMLV